jgi:hypothetical protein
MSSNGGVNSTPSDPRAVALFLNATPTTSMYAMLNGHVEISFNVNHTVGITEQLISAEKDSVRCGSSVLGLSIVG